MSNQQDIEEQIVATGLNAPRITSEQLDEEIVSAQYYRAPNATTTICLLTLKNGFTITGESSCVSLENFDEELGRSIAFDNARDKLWAFLGFRLKDQLYQEQQAEKEG